MTEAIDRPEHYDGDECMKAIEECGLARGFILGSMLKYAWRHGRKDTTEVAMGKALWYLRRGIENGRIDAMSLADRYVVERFLGLVSGEPEAAEVIAEAKAWLDAAARKAPAPSMYEVIDDGDGWSWVSFKGKQVSPRVSSHHIVESLATRLQEAYLIGYGEQLGSDVIAHSDHWHAEAKRLAAELKDARAEASTTIAELTRQLERSRELQRGAEAQCVRAQQEREELRRRLHAMAEGRDGDMSYLAELRHRLEAAVAQRDELGIRCAEAQRKAEVLARQVEQIQADRDELAGHAGDLQNRLGELTRERDALKRHYDAAAPEHNLLALLDLYMNDLHAAEKRIRAAREILDAEACTFDGDCVVCKVGSALADDRDPEQRPAVPRPEADEWPLLCVEEIDVDGDTSYRVLDDGEAPPDGCRAFRCRWAAQGFEWPSMEERGPEIELGPEATEEDVAYHLCYDPRLAAALSQPGETVLLDDYDHRVNAAPETDEWPLLCMDDPQGELDKLTITPGEPPPEGARLWRCRAVKGGRTINRGVLAQLVTVIYEDHESWLNGRMFGGGPIPDVGWRPGAEEALKRWADEWLEVDAFELGPEVELYSCDACGRPTPLDEVSTIMTCAGEGTFCEECRGVKEVERG